MRTALALLVLCVPIVACAAVGVWQLVSLNGLVSTTAARLERLFHQYGMTHIVYTASLPGGGTLTLNVYKQSDETAEQFATRAAAEWAAVKAANGL